MRENRPSGSEGGAGANPLFLPLSHWGNPSGARRSDAPVVFGMEWPEESGADRLTNRGMPYCTRTYSVLHYRRWHESRSNLNSDSPTWAAGDSCRTSNGGWSRTPKPLPCTRVS